MKPEYEAIVIGASAGGMQALSSIFKELPADFCLPIIVVQHLPMEEDEEGLYAHVLNRLNSIRVKEANIKETIQPATVYLAPGGYHLLIEEDKSFGLSLDSRVNHSRPSIDVLFESAADVYENKLIGIILTGANADGSKGLQKIEATGGFTIVQAPNTAEAQMMPLEALKATQSSRKMDLKEIGPFLRRFHVK